MALFVINVNDKHRVKLIGKLKYFYGSSAQLEAGPSEKSL